MSHISKTVALALICLVALLAIPPRDARAGEAPASVELTCATASEALHGNEPEFARPGDQAIGTVGTLRNLLCFVGEWRCSCLEETLRIGDPKYRLWEYEMGLALGRCWTEAPDRSFSGVVQEFTLDVVCENRTTCIDEGQIDPSLQCVDISDPVCGCDGRDYGNGCEAEKAGVTSWEEGTCNGACLNPSRFDPDANCMPEYAPVCGCDGRTYTNACEAQNSGLLSWDDGACSDGCIDPARVDSSAGCPEIFAPVCGCDEVTYDNSCEADNAGLVFYTEGECCIDPEQIEPEPVCPPVFDPVCGCDGQQYGNTCEATAAGLTRWSDGPCPLE